MTQVDNCEKLVEDCRMFGPFNSQAKSARSSPSLMYANSNLKRTPKFHWLMSYVSIWTGICTS